MRSSFAKEGIEFKKVDKSKGSRIARANEFRRRLYNAAIALTIDSYQLHQPGIYFLRGTCTVLTDELPKYRNDPDVDGDIEGGANDHPYDALTYTLMAEPRNQEIETLSHPEGLH